MPREKSPEREKAFLLYKNSGGSILITEIAAQLNIPVGTVRGWKSKDNWGGQLNGTFRKNAERSKKEKSIEKKLIASVACNNELNDRQKEFCLHYVKTFNAAMSYKRVYGCKSHSAAVSGSNLLKQTKIRDEINRLKKIRSTSMLATADDVVDRYMKIAFADISDYVEWGRSTVPIMGHSGPVEAEDPETGEKVPVTKEVNEVRLIESSEIDGTLLSEVKQSRDGASVKLADRMKALDWLTNYFELNPFNRHNQEYKERKLEIELLKTQASIKPSGEDTIPDDGFKAALNDQAGTVWQDGDDTEKEKSHVE